MDRDRLSILLVDDDESFARILAIQLRHDWPLDVTIVNSGTEAVSRLKNPSHGFDVILLDYMMPEMSGINVLQWMLEQKVETPAVMLTGAGTESVAVETMKLGAFDYLRKETIDIPHVVNVIYAAHECHQFRVDRRVEGEEAIIRRRDEEATRKLEEIVRSLTPAFNDTFARLTVEVERQSSRVANEVPPEKREEWLTSVKNLQDGILRLEDSVRLLLSMYAMAYVHSSGSGELENIRKKIELMAAQTK